MGSSSTVQLVYGVLYSAKDYDYDNPRPFESDDMWYNDSPFDPTTNGDTDWDGDDCDVVLSIASVFLDDVISVNELQLKVLENAVSAEDILNAHQWAKDNGFDWLHPQWYVVVSYG